MPEDLLVLAAAALSALALAAIGIAYHKLSGMLQALRCDVTARSDNVVSQLESVIALYARMGGLPALPRSRGWAASPDMLHNVVLLVQTHRPTLALECSSGLSTLVLANEFRRLGQGKVISLEHDSFYAAATRSLLRASGLEEWAEVIHAPLVEQSVNGWQGRWYDLAALPSVAPAQLLVVDGPPSTTAPLARYPALPLLANRLQPGAVIIADDADRPDEMAMVSRWLQEQPSLRSVPVATCEKGCVALKLAEI